MPRPRLHPTDEQRKCVKSLAALGLAQHQIAAMVGIRSEKTLRKYFRPELHRGDLEGYAKVCQTKFQMATDGKHWPATKAWEESYHRRHGQDPGVPGSPTEKREVTRIFWRRAEQLKKDVPPKADIHPPAASPTFDSSTSNKGEKQEAEPETEVETEDAELPDLLPPPPVIVIQAASAIEPDEDSPLPTGIIYYAPSFIKPDED